MPKFFTYQRPPTVNKGKWGDLKGPPPPGRKAPPKARPGAAIPHSGSGSRSPK